MIRIMIILINFVFFTNDKMEEVLKSKRIFIFTSVDDKGK